MLDNVKNQAVVITAYKDFNQLVRLVTMLKDFFVLYIHVDKKQSSLYKSLIDLVGDEEDVFVFSIYSVGWGGANHLNAIRSLLKKALSNKTIEYVHIISGQDYLIGNNQDFSVLLSDRKAYMTCARLENTSAEVQNRYNKYHIALDGFDIRSRAYCRFDKLFCKIQKNKQRIGVFKLNQIYKGMVWCSLPIDAVRYVNCYTRSIKGRIIMFDLRFCLIPEEIFFQTILMNSPFRERCVFDNRRYTVWACKNGSIPAILDITDYCTIKKGNYLFCRKVDSAISKELIDALNSNTK